jgi:GNAT superfamily N-acetyltransferase
MEIDASKVSIFRWYPKSQKEIRPLMKGTTVTSSNPKEANWFLAVNERGEKVGCCCVVIKDNSARFKSLVVIREYRGLGVGRKLWNARWSWTMKQNVTKITTFTNKMSRPFFIKSGFSCLRVIGRGERGDTWYMVLRLKEK